MSNCERCAHVPFLKKSIHEQISLLSLNKRATVRDCSGHSWQKSNSEKITLNLFKIERGQWFACNSSKWLSNNKQFARKRCILQCFFDSFPPFYTRSESLPSLFARRAFLKSDIHSLHSWKKSDHERFAPVAHDKRAMGAICSFSQVNLSFAHKKQANRSPCFLQKSDHERVALFHMQIYLLLTKNEWLARKTNERIPNPAKK